MNANRLVWHVGFIISNGSEGSGSGPAPSGIGILSPAEGGISPWMGREDAPRQPNVKMVLSSGLVFSRPRLPALIPPDPEPRYGGGQVEEALWIGPGMTPDKCHPCLFTI